MKRFIKLLSLAVFITAVSAVTANSFSDQITQDGYPGFIINAYDFQTGEDTGELQAGVSHRMVLRETGTWYPWTIIDVEWLGDPANEFSIGRREYHSEIYAKFSKPGTKEIIANVKVKAGNASSMIIPVTKVVYVYE